jgi:hypothetical protein
LVRTRRFLQVSSISWYATTSQASENAFEFVHVPRYLPTPSGPDGPAEPRRALEIIKNHLVSDNTCGHYEAFKHLSAISPHRFRGWWSFQLPHSTQTPEGIYELQDRCQHQVTPSISLTLIADRSQPWASQVSQALGDISKPEGISHIRKYVFNLRPNDVWRYLWIPLKCLTFRIRRHVRSSEYHLCRC